MDEDGGPGNPGQLAAGQFGRAADVATQRHKAIEIAMQDGDGKRASHLELWPDAKRLLTGERRTRAHHQELRHEIRLRKFLDEGRAPWRKGSDAKGKAKKRANTRTRGKDARISMASPKESPASIAKLSRGKPLQHREVLFGGVGSPPVGGGPGACGPVGGRACP